MNFSSMSVELSISSISQMKYQTTSQTKCTTLCCARFTTAASIQRNRIVGASILARNKWPLKSADLICMARMWTRRIRCSTFQANRTRLFSATTTTRILTTLVRMHFTKYIHCSPIRWCWTNASSITSSTIRSNMVPTLAAWVNNNHNSLGSIAFSQK